MFFFLSFSLIEPRRGKSESWRVREENLLAVGMNLTSMLTRTVKRFKIVIEIMSVMLSHVDQPLTLFSGVG